MTKLKCKHRLLCIPRRETTAFIGIQGSRTQHFRKVWEQETNITKDDSTTSNRTEGLLYCPTHVRGVHGQYILLVVSAQVIPAPSARQVNSQRTYWFSAVLRVTLEIFFSRFCENFGCVADGVPKVYRSGCGFNVVFFSTTVYLFWDIACGKTGLVVANRIPHRITPR